MVSSPVVNHNSNLVKRKGLNPTASAIYPILLKKKTAGKT